MSSALAFLGISHTPLLGLNPVAPEVENALRTAIADARQCIAQFKPDRVVLIAPDHYNAFFHQLMPTLCIGTVVTGIGDFGTPSGELNVDEAGALALADGLMDDGFDLAVSRRMKADHGFTQPLQLLWDGLDTPPIIPLFVNAAAPPAIIRMRRARALGNALGRRLAADGKRTLFIGSGGLSHEPPVPSLDTAEGVMRERIMAPWVMTEQDWAQKVERVCAAGRAMAAGTSGLKPLNPAWDARWMDALEQGNANGALDRLVTLREEDIGAEAGNSAHESKNWLIGRCALPENERLQCQLRFYRDIPDFIAGFGIMFLQAAR